MTRFLVGKISRGRMGCWWWVEGVSHEDKTHPFAKKELFDGDLSPQQLLKEAWNDFGVSPNDIRFRS